MSRLNIELFKKMRERIATSPDSYNQQSWCQSDSIAPCGTAACLAGEAIVCAAPSVGEGVRRLRRLVRSDDEYAVPRFAASLLGLEGDYAAYGEDEMGETAMFHGDAKYWPEDYRMMFMAADNRYSKAHAAVAYLDHIIETGRVLD